MQSIYDRKLSNSLSHELLTPLNCIVNLSEELMDSPPDGVFSPAQFTNQVEQIWSSGKILDFTVRSMINRERFNDNNRVLKVASKTT